MENELFELKWYLKDGYKELCEVLEREQCCVFQATMGLGKSMVAFNYGVTYSENTLIVSPKRDIANEWKKRYPAATCITYAKFYRLNENNNYMVTDEYSLFDYDLVILDECHHASSAIWRKNVELLKEKSDIKILGLTADTIRYLDNMLDVAEDLFDGNIVRSFNFYEAIEHGVLPGFRYVGCKFISYEDFFNIKEKFNKNKIDSHILVNKLSDCVINDNKIVEILKEEMPEGEKKGIVFSANIEAINHDKELIETAFPGYKVWVIHSKMKRKTVDEYIEEFKNSSVGFLITVNMVNEGFHPDDINAIISFRKTCSFNLLMQQWGRIMSKDNLGRDMAIIDIMASAFNIKSYLGSNVDKYFINPLNEINNYDECKKKIITKYYCEEGYDVMKQIMEKLSDNWTKEEDEIIRKLYPKNNLKTIQEALPNRTEYSIRSRASLLGVTNKKSKSWTKEEDEIIRKLYPERGVKAVQEALPYRTKYSIIDRAKILGATNKNKFKLWTKEEDEIIRKLYPENGSEAIHEALPHRTKNSITHRASKLGLVYNKSNLWTKEEDEIIRKLYPEGGFKAVQEALPYRSKNSIMGRAKIFRLTYKKSELWTKEEDEIICKLYPENGFKVVQEALPNRSEGAIRIRVTRLDLTKK